MFSWFADRYNRIFAALLCVVVAVSFYIRPLNSPWHPFVAGDGLGYYSYLPAKFLHHDSELTFGWFSETYNANYVYDAFENPEDNLLVRYGDKRINKYYPGLSFVWFPFFMAGHIAAHWLDYPTDGFSLPYQWAIGFGSLCYLLMGLVFLRKLLLLLFGDQRIAVIVPCVIFAGTHLFTYAIVNNTLSHAYSFTFIVAFIYHAIVYFRHPEKRTSSFLWALFFLVITVSIRPLNGLIVFALPAFLPEGFIRSRKFFSSFRRSDVIAPVLTLLALGWHFHITYTQTGSLFAYTYTDEKFDLLHPKFTDALFSYHVGLFVYAPLLLFSFFGIPFLGKRQRIILPLLFFGMVYLYSSWWFWPITKRALIDFYVIPAICLGALLARIRTVKWQYIALGVITLAVIHFQLKVYQLNNGILSEHATYGDLYWRNYFRTDRANIYPVPPSTIMEQEVHTEDFERENSTPNRSTEKFFSGNASLLLDQKWSSMQVAKLSYPVIFDQDGWRKVRFSFNMFAEDSVNNVYVYIQFFRNDSLITDAPFYIIPEYIFPGKWDYKEFGYEIADTALINRNTIDHIGFTIWNAEAKKRVFIDDVKIEFLLTDRSFETIR